MSRKAFRISPLDSNAAKTFTCHHLTQPPKSRHGDSPRVRDVAAFGRLSCWHTQLSGCVGESLPAHASSIYFAELCNWPTPFPRPTFPFLTARKRHDLGHCSPHLGSAVIGYVHLALNPWPSPALGEIGADLGNVGVVFFNYLCSHPDIPLSCNQWHRGSLTIRMDQS